MFGLIDARSATYGERGAPEPVLQRRGHVPSARSSWLIVGHIVSTAPLQNNSRPPVCKKARLQSENAAPAAVICTMISP